jgi:hypothetical protein
MWVRLPAHTPPRGEPGAALIYGRGKENTQEGSD